MCTYQILGIELIIECTFIKILRGVCYQEGGGGRECINKDNNRKGKHKRVACGAHIRLDINQLRYHIYPILLYSLYHFPNYLHASARKIEIEEC